MPYDRAADIVGLAVRLQGSWSGLTLDDIQRDFDVSRRTAERLRDAVEDVFGPLEMVDTGEARRHWRLRAPILRHAVSVSAEELAELDAAATALERTGLEERAVMLRCLDDKLRALLEAESLSGIEPDVQALTEAEGLAMRPGPRPRLDEGLLATLRDAIKLRRVVAFDYPTHGAGGEHPPPRRALRPAVRQPSLPRRTRRTRRRDAAVAPVAHRRGLHHRRVVYARPDVRPAALREPFIRNVSGEPGDRGPALRPKRR